MSTQESSSTSSGGARVGGVTAVLAVVTVVAVGIAVVSQLETRRLRAELATKPALVEQRVDDRVEDDEPSGSGSGAPVTNPATPSEVPASFIDTVLASYSIVAPARIVPAKEKGEAIGFKVFSIQPRSVYEKIGLQNGDIVLRVNDLPLTDEASARAAQEKLRGVNKLHIDVKRMGNVLRLDYTVTNDADDKPK